MTAAVLVQHDAETVTLLLNRPEQRNALSHALLTALADALADPIIQDRSGVVITGAGKCFSAGGDWRELTGTIRDLAIDEDITMVTHRIGNLQVPVTAVLNGPCLGGAVDIALSCDQRVAAPGACLQVPASRLGLLYNPVAVQRMVLRYGREIVTRLLVTGERFDAPAALAAGLVSSVTGDGSVDDRARVHRDIGTDELTPVAVATRKMINAIDRGEFDPEYWHQVRCEIMGSPERYEAVARFKSRMLLKHG